MATSKLDYLQKYISGDADKKKKRKKETSGSRNARVKIIDDDAAVDRYAPTADDAERAWDMKEDAPVIVDEIVEQRPKQLGTWNTIEPESVHKPSAPRRADPSPPRRRRHDSDDDASPPRRQRHDSDNDASPPRRQRRDSDNDASPPRRKRHDSDNDASPPRKPKQITADASPPRRQRHNSDASPPRKQRNEENTDASPPRRRNRSDFSPQQSRSSKGAQEATVTKRTASGHAAGLQSGTTFGEQERKIREQQLANAPKVEGQGETVYRDRKGRKVDMLNEFMRQEAIREGKEVRLKEQEYEWGRGAVQKKSEEQAKQDFEELKLEPFARTIEDPKLEAMRKQTIRDGDPMAEYMQALQPRASSTRSAKPMYKGPPPPPNRFGLKPGYRWDGIDRSNGWEHKILTRGNDAIAREEEAYRWRSADL